jgi:hypothetical protein
MAAGTNERMNYSRFTASIPKGYVAKREEMSKGPGPRFNSSYQGNYAIKKSSALIGALCANFGNCTP